jgi:hypothetical protein
MNKPTLPIPLRPDPNALRSRGAQTLVRAVMARAGAELGNCSVEEQIKQHWGSDRDVEMITRASVSPATVSGSGWANTLASTAVVEFIASMGPASAGAALLSRGLTFEFNGATQIVVPGLIAAANKVGFVGEANPIPVVQFVSSGATLDPKSLKVITTFTREIFAHSTPTIESLVRTILVESTALTLDSVLLDTNPATADRPAGLRNGIAAITASNDPDFREAMAADIGALAVAVSGVAANFPLTFVASPPQAAKLRMAPATTLRAVDVLASSALSAGTVIAIAPNCLVSATDPLPRIDRSSEALLHMDSVPSQIATGGVMVAPTRSLWQSDTIALRLRFEVSWALRSAQGLAWLTGTNW